MISFEGKPVVASLDSATNSWQLKILPLRSYELAAYRVRGADPGVFALMDKVRRFFC